jgi:putative inorganic carbon (HCO3(-)) transporter
MRDLALALTLAVLLPLVFRFPFVGVYLWEWMALMNPHRLVYSFAQGQPFNMVIAIVTLGAWVFWSEKTTARVTPLMIVVLLFSAWISLTTAFAPAPEVTTDLWNRNIKTMLLVVLIMMGITNRVRLEGLIWIVVISIGYYGVRGGAFVILTGGAYRVFGPTQTMIEDNNSLALALIMTLPLMNYLRLHARHRILRLGSIAAMGLMLAAIVGTYSRGGLLAMAAMLGFLWLKSRARLATGLVGMILVSATLLFMPAKYFERISTINNVQEDSSFQGRVDAWVVALGVAKDHVLGAGFDGPRQPAIWNQYRPGAESRASHSIYFMVLGEHGFIGLILYLAICFLAWRNLSKVMTLTRGKPEQLWARDMAAALQVGMIGFLVGGAALPMAYYDGFLTLIAMTLPLRMLIEAKLAPDARPKWLRLRTPAPELTPAAR